MARSGRAGRRRQAPVVWILAVVSLVALVAGGVTALVRSRPSGEPSGSADPHAGHLGGGSSAMPAHFATLASGGLPNEDLRPSRGMFATECRHSHSSNDDPIVYPGKQGAAHHHDFFGNTTTDFTSTIDSLTASKLTTCRMKTDTAAYWAPALARDGRWIEPASSDAYYRVAPGVDAKAVKAYPKGLMMIAGDGHAASPQPTAIVAWACDRSLRVSVDLPSCPEHSDLTMRVTFQDCWDNKSADSEDHRSHVAYSGPDGCPLTHPVPMPQLTFVVHYPYTGPTDGLSLSPGSLLTGHADFVNTWDQDSLENEIDKCLRRAVICDPPGGTGGSPPTF